MHELDLTRPEAPRARFTKSAFVPFSTLLSNLGLRERRWWVESGERHGDDAIYQPELAPLEPLQLKAIELALASPLLAGGKSPTEDDQMAVDEAWLSVAHEFPFAEAPDHVDNLYRAILLPPPGLTPPRPANRSKATTRAAAPAAQASRPEPAAAAPAAPGTLSPLEALSALLSQAFPETSTPPEGCIGCLAFVAARAEDSSILPTFRLYFFSDEGGQKQIRDIKEQETFLSADLLANSVARLPAFVAGWRRAVHEVMKTANLDAAARWMPWDLDGFAVLGLKKAQTEADFYKALMQRSRFGKLVLLRHAPIRSVQNRRNLSATRKTPQGEPGTHVSIMTEPGRKVSHSARVGQVLKT